MWPRRACLWKDNPERYIRGWWPGPHAEVCLCMGQLDEIQGQLPMQSLYLTAQQEISSACAAVSPDVVTTVPTCASMSCPMLWAAPCAMRDRGASISMDTPAPTSLPGGEDPLLGSMDGTLTEPLMG